jgi:5-methylcytosine-specific restriction endonuclease McrA
VIGAREEWNMPGTFIIQGSEAEVKKEREKARLLRKTRWWKQRLARGVCHYCQRRFPPSGLTMDHIVPLIRGGKTTKGNVVAVCKECNSKKKYLLPMEWEAYIHDSLGKK